MNTIIDRDSDNYNNTSINNNKNFNKNGNVLFSRHKSGKKYRYLYNIKNNKNYNKLIIAIAMFILYVEVDQLICCCFLISVQILQDYYFRLFYLLDCSIFYL